MKYIIVFFLLFSAVTTSYASDSLSYKQTKKLKEALVYYKVVLQSGKWITIDFPADSLKNWKTSKKTVFALRNNLVSTHDLDFFENEASSEVDSFLTNAIQNYQRRHALPATGELDNITLEHLKVPISYRIKQIELNLLRWEKFHIDGELFALVNVPDFTISIIKSGKVDFISNVIVGKKSTPTVLFEDEIEQVIINPTWNVPNSIEKNELFHKIKKDPDYLSKNHFKLYDELDKGREVSSSHVNWSGMTSSNFHYTIVQSPGPWNALGRIKFLFPNPYNIYLHDTPEKSLFRSRIRAFSHGCIRVEKPVELALYLLEDQGVTPEDIKSLIDQNSTKGIMLSEKVPISISYFTSWVDEQNQLQFREDIYNLDRKEFEYQKKTFFGKLLSGTASVIKKIF